MTAFVIPRDRDKRRSHPVDGVAESLVKSKKYLLPLVVLAPEVTGGVAVAYLADGRLKLPKGTPIFEVGDEETAARQTSRPRPARCCPSRRHKRRRRRPSPGSALHVSPLTQE
jgi:hypothetical protein